MQSFFKKLFRKTTVYESNKSPGLFVTIVHRSKKKDGDKEEIFIHCYRCDKKGRPEGGIINIIKKSLNDFKNEYKLLK